MVAVDILSVPVSASGNKCLLVVQDYFTKWADAIPLPNQMAITITKALVNLFATMGMPEIVLTKVRTLRVWCSSKLLRHLAYKSPTLQPITHKAMALSRGLITPSCNYFVHTLLMNLIGNDIYL